MPPSILRPSQFLSIPLNTNMLPLLKADPTETTFSNSAVENTLWSWTLPGGTLGANDAFYLTFLFILLSNATGEFYAHRIYFGATNILTTNISPPVNGNIYSGIIRAYIKNNGATNSQKGIMETFFALNSAGVAVAGGATGTAAIDSTVNQTIKLTCQFSDANASQTIVHQMSIVHYMKNT